MDFIILGERIRAERIKNHITQEALAEKCDISKNFVSLIENGRNMSLETIIKIANVFGVTVDYLLTDIVTPNPDNVVEEAAINLKSLSDAEKRYFMNMIKQYISMKRTID